MIIADIGVHVNGFDLILLSELIADIDVFVCIAVNSAEQVEG